MTPHLTLLLEILRYMPFLFTLTGNMIWVQALSVYRTTSKSLAQPGLGTKHTCKKYKPPKVYFESIFKTYFILLINTLNFTQTLLLCSGCLIVWVKN